MKPTEVRWYHRKGSGPYVIEMFAVNESDLEPLVVYRRVSLETNKPFGTAWVRTAAEFFDGRFRQTLDPPHGAEKPRKSLPRGGSSEALEDGFEDGL